jgi:acetyl-CoA carboxylase biotin carboxyl carrier protein
VPRRDRSANTSFSDPDLVARLTSWLEASGASELEITTQDGRALKIVLGDGPRPAPVHNAVAVPAEMPEPAGRPIKAPIAGVFRDRHPAADASPLAGEGRALDAGAVVGFVEVGPMLLPVSAPETAVVAEVLACAGDLVGYGDIILTTEPAR